MLRTTLFTGFLSRNLPKLQQKKATNEYTEHRNISTPINTSLMSVASPINISLNNNYQTPQPDATQIFRDTTPIPFNQNSFISPSPILINTPAAEASNSPTPIPHNYTITPQHFTSLPLSISLPLSQSTPVSLSDSVVIDPPTLPVILIPENGGKYAVNVSSYSHLQAAIKMNENLLEGTYKLYYNKYEETFPIVDQFSLELYWKYGQEACRIIRKSVPTNNMPPHLPPPPAGDHDHDNHYSHYDPSIPHFYSNPTNTSTSNPVVNSNNTRALYRSPNFYLQFKLLLTNLIALNSPPRVNADSVDISSDSNYDESTVGEDEKLQHELENTGDKDEADEKLMDETMRVEISVTEATADGVERDEGEENLTVNSNTQSHELQLTTTELLPDIKEDLSAKSSTTDNPKDLVAVRLSKATASPSSTKVYTRKLRKSFSILKDILHKSTSKRHLEKAEPNNDQDKIYHDDIDVEDADDPQLCATYVNEIYEHLREIEELYRPIDYMKFQKDITPKMRGILVDWIIDVASEHRLSSETLYLSVNYIDRYLSKNTASRNDLQLVGAASLLIASKYEEIYAVTTDDLVDMADNAYTKEKLLAMETQMLNSLEFCLSGATIKSFLRRFLKAGVSSAKDAMLANFLCELSLVEYDFTKYLPSVVAASAVYYTRHASNKTPCWNNTLEYYTRVKETDENFRQCVTAIYNLHTKVSQSTTTTTTITTTAVKTKYSHADYFKISEQSVPCCAPFKL